VGTRLNRYYNNPAIGSAMENIASIFAPPSAQEIAGYAQANKLRQESAGLEQLYGIANDPNADMGMLDRLGAATGQWNPNQGFGARDMADATNRYGVDVGASTARRGQDVSAATSASNNIRDNQRGAITSLFGPRDQTYDQPAVPDEFMSAIGLPGIAAMPGRDKPLSETEVEAQLLQDAIGNGMVGPYDAAEAYKSNVNIEQVIGADIDGDGVNDPVNVARGNAIGRQPFVNPGSAPAAQIKTYRTPDGKSGTAVWDPSSQTLTDTVSKEALPQGTITGDVTDTATGMTTGMNTEVQGRGLAITSGLETLGRVEKLIAENPAAQGVGGLVRGTAQDMIQAGNELGMLFGGTMQEVASAAAEDPNLQSIVGQMYDPNIPAIEMLTNVLAWQYAKSFAGARVSNEQLRIAKQAVGAGAVFGNQQSSLARMAELRNLFQTEGRRLNPMLPPEIAAGLGPLLDVASPNAPTGAARPRATNPQTNETVEWDGTAWRPVAN
jgi:hypothetical protein